MMQRLDNLEKQNFLLAQIVMTLGTPEQQAMVKRTMQMMSPELVPAESVPVVERSLPVRPVQPDLLSRESPVSVDDILPADMTVQEAEQVLRESNMTLKEAEAILARMG